MLIGIDASQAAKEKRTGVEEVVYQLALTLPNIDETNQYILYSQTPLPKELTTAKNAKNKVLPSPYFWNRLRLPAELLLHKPDVMLVPGYRIPAFAPDRTAVIIHDLAYKYFPDAYSKFELAQQEAAAKRAATKASKILFVSESAQEDFLKYHTYNKKQTAVIDLAYDNKRFKVRAKSEDVLHLGKRYILFIGRLEERKNLRRIIQAYTLFRQVTNLDHALVLAGGWGFGKEAIIAEIEKNKHKDDIITPGYIPHEKLPDLYAKASLFVFPSLYEGFGIPVLEAFASGIPVITSKTSSLPEVAGDAALLVNPEDQGEIGQAMVSVLTNPEKEHELIERGIARANTYNWDKTAEQVLKVLQSM